MFWSILSSMDDTQSIQMSKHKNKEVWDVLHQVISSHDDHDNSQEYNEDEFFQSFSQLPKNVPRDQEGQMDSQCDTGGSSSFNYGHVEKLESHARMVRFDQQMMRALSSNMIEHPLFLSTPKFISDLTLDLRSFQGHQKKWTQLLPPTSHRRDQQEPAIKRLHTNKTRDNKHTSRQETS